MVDYRTQVAALERFRQVIAQQNDPQVVAVRDQQLSDAAQAPGMALLGCLHDHLLWHASSGGVELSLLERASALWQHGMTLYMSLATFRLHLETALSNPNDAAEVQALNDAAAQLQLLASQVLDHAEAIEALRKDVSKFHHLLPHPRQEDRPTGLWDWGNLFLARRTDAYTRSVRRHAADKPSSAFAFGVLSRYGASACGSAYLGQVIGGPRRGHRRRNRLARNAMGSWFAEHQAGLPSLTAVAQAIKQEAPTGLPSSIAALIRASTAATYDRDRTASLPDLQVGYQRLMRHLELLDGFTLPPEPVTPREPFLTKLFGDAAKPYTPTMPAEAGLTEAGVPGGSGGGGAGGVVPQNQASGTDDGPDHSEPPASTEVKCGAFWESIGSALLFLLGGWFACALRWGDDDRCPLWDNITQNWEEAFPDGAQGAAEFTAGGSSALTGAEIANMAQVDQVTQLVGDIFTLQSQMWEGFGKAADFLALFGLVYPDGLLKRWRYAQHLKTPARAPGTWPHLPDDGARFDEYPLTGVEQPAVDAIAYPPGATPGVVLAGLAGTAVATAASVSVAVWRQMASNTLDANNLDLDSDRGPQHSCWAALGSINDQPIDIAVLGYDEI